MVAPYVVTDARFNSALIDEERIMFIIGMYARTRNYVLILNEFKEKYGLHWRDCQRYIARAKQRILDQVKEDNNLDIRAILQNKLQDIIFGKLTSNKDQIAAIKALAAIALPPKTQRIELVDGYSKMSPEQLKQEAERMGLVPPEDDIIKNDRPIPSEMESGTAIPCSASGGAGGLNGKHD